MMDKKMDENLDFLKDKFDNDGLQVPDALSEDAIRQMLAQETNTADANESASQTNSIAAADKSQPTAAPGKSRPKRRWSRRVIAAAACVVLVIALIPAMRAILPSGSDSSSSYVDPSSLPTLTADASGLHQFSSYDELDQEMAALLPEQSETDSNMVFYAQEEMAGVNREDDMADSDMAMEDAETSGDAPAFAKNESNSTDGASQPDQATQPNPAAQPNHAASDSAAGKDPQHSNTYTQVEGIDEADIVKTDGKYIYYLSTVENQIIIARAANGKAKRISAVSGSSEEYGSYIDDIYIRGDQLIVIGSGERSRTGDSSDLWAETTVVTVYDISDRANPKQLSQYSQTGDLLSSRLVDGRLVLVTNDRFYSYEKGRNLPYVSYGAGKPHRLPIGNISCFPGVSDATFTVIGMFDLTTGKASKDTVKTKAVLGGSDEIYCSGPHLYISGTIYDQPPGALTRNGESTANDGSRKGWFSSLFGSDTGSGDRNSSSSTDVEDALTDSSSVADGADVPTEMESTSLVYDPVYPQWRTQILKVSLDGGKVKYNASAIVSGTVNNQFSMDERNGFLRAATTSQHDGVDVNNLYVLNRKMKQVGSVIGFAKDEHIESVRFIKDKAYVITYRQTDPLFIIDLADPTDPVIEGHVKISGFSTLLVPADADHLLGLGFSTEENEFGEATNGVKLALFDISDPSHPKVADSKAFADMSSQVQYDHKALLVGPGADYYAIPYNVYHDPWIDDGGDVIIEDAEEPDADSTIAEGDAGSDYDANGSDADKGSGSDTDAGNSPDTGSGSSSANSDSFDDGNGILVFSAKAGHLKVLDDLHTDEPVNRCIYIDDYIYGICSDDSIEGFHVGE